MIVELAIIISTMELLLTVFYVRKYKKWQPEKSYKQMESNPLLIFSWNSLGFVMGSIIGILIIVIAISFVTIALRTFGFLVPIFLSVAFINNGRNLIKLNKLIKEDKA